jgi:CubicO group peptidase (beta-lactamase class C family)
VLDEFVMSPMGSSGRWEWRGYRNSTVEIDGRAMESVSGGSHWGGGMFIGSRDHALLGLLMLNRGQWNGRRLLSEEWIRQAIAPCDLNPLYGFMWWLNTNQAAYPSAPATSIRAVGAGTNLIWIDPDHDLVAVVRWIDKEKVDGFFNAVLKALR